MGVPLEKLYDFKGNKYVFTKAAMEAIDKVDMIRDFPEGSRTRRVVQNVLNLALNEKLHVDHPLATGF